MRDFRFPSLNGTRLLPERLAFSALCWSIIPGLGHLKLNQKKLGKWLLGTWLICLMLSLLLLGTSLHSWFWMLTLVVHSVAITSIFAANLSYEGVLIRMVFGLGVFLGLSYLIYGPVQFLGSQVCVLFPVSRIESNPLVEQSDVLLCLGPWLRANYEVGDLVLYHVRGQSGSNYYVRTGVGLDRILAGPGDRVRLENGQLQVNGAPLPAGRQPLRAIQPQLRLDTTLASNHYLILPTILDLYVNQEAMRQGGVYDRMMRSVMIVSSDAIIGPVVYRIRPLSRWGPVR